MTDKTVTDVTLDPQQAAKKIAEMTDNTNATNEQGKVYTTATEKAEILAEQIANAPDSIETATKGKGKVARAKKVKEEPKQPEPLVMFKADSEDTSVCLNDLVPLDKLPIENAILAMREIDKQNVDHLFQALQNGDELPPIDIVATNYGPVPFDGYHRWAAYEKYLVDALSEETPSGEMVVDNDALVEARKQLFIPAKQHTVTSERQLLQLAFSANLKHGLPATDASRSRFALWLYKESQLNDEKPISIREAARQANVSHVAVLKLQGRIEAAKKKMIDVMLQPEEQAELDAMLPVSETEDQKFRTDVDKHLQAILKAANFFFKKELPTSELQGYGAAVAIQTNKDVIGELRDIVGYIWQAAPAAAAPEQKELLKA